MKTSDQADTKTRILDAAERLFAERGFAATSHRHITSEAGANLAAVNYHFGSKEELLNAVFVRRLGPVNRVRLERLRGLDDEAGATPSVEPIVRAFIEPAFEAMRELGEAGERFMQLVGRSHSETSERLRACFVDQFQDVHTAFLSAFARALPGVSDSELMARYHFMVGAMAHTLAWLRKPKGEGIPRQLQDPDALCTSLVRFAAAGMAGREGRT